MHVQNTSRSRPRKHGSSRAYTLIELLIVMLIIAILAAAGAPKFSNSLTQFRLDAVVHRVVGDLKYARRAAQQTSAPVTVNFDVASNRYTLSGVTSTDRPGQTFAFSLAQSEYACALVSANFGSGSSLTFNIYGQPNNSGSIVVRCGTLTRTITVNDKGQVASS